MKIKKLIINGEEITVKPAPVAYKNGNIETIDCKYSENIKLRMLAESSVFSLEEIHTTIETCSNYMTVEDIIDDFDRMCAIVSSINLLINDTYESYFNKTPELPDNIRFEEKEPKANEDGWYRKHEFGKKRRK